MRKLVTVLVVIILAFSIGVACASDDVLFVDFLTASDDDLQDAINQIANVLESHDYSVEVSIIKNSDNNESATSISLNQKITISNIAEFTIMKIAYSTQVKPPRPGDYYSYYAVDNLANKFIDLTIKVKNLTKSIESVENLLNVVIIYNGDYEYTAQAAVESNDGKDLNYANIYGINPLNTSTCRFFVELPKTVVDDKSNITIRITVGDNSYYFDENMQVRKGK